MAMQGQWDFGSSTMSVVYIEFTSRTPRDLILPDLGLAKCATSLEICV
jgi:hypothetical protein